MKRALFVVLGFVCVLVTPAFAHADTAYDAAVVSLRGSPVYVAPGTEGTNSDTAGLLKEQLNDGDNIVIVMLPASAAPNEEDVSAILAGIDKNTKNQKIIALSSGDKRVAFSAILPPGQASDLMKRADSVATNNVEAMTTFVTNVHDWQALHPKAKASKPIGQKEKGSGTPLWLFVLCVLAVFSIAVVAVLYFSGSTTDSDEIKFRSPDEVRDPLRDIYELRSQVADDVMRDVIVQICIDTEAYFRRRQNNGDAKVVITEFEAHLKSMRDVLTKYIDIQQNHRYYKDPQQQLDSGLSAAEGFASYVLDCVRDDSSRSMIDFRVDTDILSAKRYS